MPEKQPPRSYLSLALGALVAELDVQFPGLSDRARRRLKREADTSLVWGLHGEHETAEDREAHSQAIDWLGRLHGVVAVQNAPKRAKAAKRKKA